MFSTVSSHSEAMYTLMDVDLPRFIEKIPLMVMLTIGQADVRSKVLTILVLQRKGAPFNNRWCCSLRAAYE
jgi:hypothetical protein